VRQRVAEERRVPCRERGVAAVRVDGVEAALVELRRPVRTAGARIGATEVRVDLEAVDREERLALDGRLQEVDGLLRTPALERELRERAAGARRRAVVSGGTRLAERLCKPLAHARAFAEADSELEVGELQLSNGGRIEVRSGLEVVCADPELCGE